jgi:RES domain-containing protein
VAGPRTVRRGGGGYNRLAEPGWADPLDTSFSKRRGGRWNPPGAFGALYLNRGRPVARLQVDHKLAGQPYGVEDLDPGEQHDLVDVEVPELDCRDCVTAAGLSGVRLPVTYPVDAAGSAVPWAACQPVGQGAYDADLAGVACRSAARGARRDDEELAVFDSRAGEVRQAGRVGFGAWYWAGESPGPAGVSVDERRH